MTLRILPAAVLLFCGCHFGTSGLRVPLRYEAMSPSYAPADTCEAASTVEFSDIRPNPSVIGERFPEERPTDSAPVTAVGSPAEWSKTAISSMARKSGLNLEQA